MLLGSPQREEDNNPIYCFLATGFQKYTTSKHIDSGLFLGRHVPSNYSCLIEIPLRVSKASKKQKSFTTAFICGLPVQDLPTLVSKI